jgi:aspartate kinase
MKDIKVFKIGGSVLHTAASFLKIARKISQWRNSRVCIVASAMKGKTNELINTFLDTTPEPEFWNLERYVSFGEIQSAILFESAFNYLGLNAKAILPWMKEWPLYVSLKSRDKLSAEKINEKRDFTLLGKSKEKIRKYVLPLFKECSVVVIPGFIAKNGKGKIVTLGRGGSDISAFLIGELLGAPELVLIKDVEGVLSLDPKINDNGRKIKSLASEELGIITSSGAQVLHPGSLKHRESLKRIKVISTNSESLEDDGTEISFAREITVKTSPEVFSVLSLVGEKIPETPGILKDISKVLSENKISIYSITISDNLLAIYVEEERAEYAYKLLAPLMEKIKNLKVLNLKKNIGKIVVRSLKFINAPGIIKKIVTPISKQGVNIWEVLTVHTDVMIFVEHNDLGRTTKIVKNIFKRKKK